MSIIKEKVKQKAAAAGDHHDIMTKLHNKFARKFQWLGFSVIIYHLA